jgi:hypothetical protein
MRRVLTLLLVALPALAARAATDAPAVSVALDRAAVEIGETVTATYTATIPARGSLELEALVTPAPAEGSAPPAGGVLDYSRPAPPKVATAKDGTTQWTLTVRLAPFAAGDIAVPGPHLVYVAPSGERTPVRGANAALHVTSRLPQGQKPEALAPKSDRPVRIPAHGVLFWTLIALAVFAAAALVWWLIRRRRAPAEAAAPAPPPLPPAEELARELDRLAGIASSLGEDPRGFYSELTHAVKRYLERRLELPVLEWTTFETVRRLRERNLEPPREIGLSELLGAADRVKFGKGRATGDEAKSHVERARLLSSHLESLLAPPPSVEGGPQDRTAS